MLWQVFALVLWIIVCLLLGRYLSLCVTVVKEGQGKLVEFMGSFSQALMTYEGFGFNDDWDIVSEKEATRLGGMRLFGGLHWVGPWPFYQLHWYKFRWTVLREREGGGNKIDTDLLTREEWMPHFLVNDATYVITVPDIEIQGNMKVTLVVIVLGRIVNPYKAFYRVRDWLRSSTDLLETKLRDWATQQTFEELNARSKSKEGPGRADDDLCEPTSVQVEQIKNDFGFAIKAIRLSDVQPDSESQKALTAVFQAERAARAREAEAVGIAESRRTTAGGEADAKRTIAAAERERAEKLASTQGGIELAGYDALKEAAQGAGSTIAFPVNIAAHLLGKIGQGSALSAPLSTSPLPTPIVPAPDPTTTQPVKSITPKSRKDKK